MNTINITLITIWTQIVLIILVLILVLRTFQGKKKERGEKKDPSLDCSILHLEVSQKFLPKYKDKYLKVTKGNIELTINKEEAYKSGAEEEAKNILKLFLEQNFQKYTKEIKL